MPGQPDITVCIEVLRAHTEERKLGRSPILRPFSVRTVDELKHLGP